MNTIKNLSSVLLFLLLLSCNQATSTNQTFVVGSDTSKVVGGQENVQDNDSQKDVVKVAVASKDHTTLVAALKQADLVTSLSNAGPFTVFAPTNEAFAKLPPGTLDELMKEEKKRISEIYSNTM